jgi:hypothetical protein
MILISNFYGSVHRFLGHWAQTKYFIYNIKRLRYGNGVYVKGLPKPFFTAVNSVTNETSRLRYENCVYVKGPLKTIFIHCRDSWVGSASVFKYQGWLSSKLQVIMHNYCHLLIFIFILLHHNCVNVTMCCHSYKLV